VQRILTISAGVIAALLAVGALWANAPISPLPPDAKADLLVVNKGERQLLAYSHGQLLRSYRVSLGRDPVGIKVREGDRRTPEGNYLIDPGGEIMVHGIHNGLGWVGKAHRLMDWTVGCIAVTDPEIEELYRIVTDGTRIEIRP